MKRLTQLAAVGSTLLLACVACTSGEGGNTHSALPSPTPTEPSRLLHLPAIDLADDPLPEQDTSVRRIGEVHNGPDRIIIYTTGQKCGLATTRKGDEKRLSINLLTEWPKDSTRGITHRPYAPYSNSSAKGSDGTWASLSCGKDAVIIKFFSPDISKTSEHRGSLDVIKPSSTGSPISIVVGTKGIRNKVSSALETHP